MDFLIATISIGRHKAMDVVTLVREGVNVLRYNTAYGTKEQIEEHINMIKKLLVKEGLGIQIMLDIPGKKTRLMVPDKEFLTVSIGEQIVISKKDISNKICDQKTIFIDEDLLLRQSSIGDKLLIDDGLIGLEIIKCGVKNTLTATVLNSGNIVTNKGVWFQSIKQEKLFGIEDLLNYNDYVKSIRPDWLAVSFASNTNLKDVRKFLAKNYSTDHNINLAAKIETKDSVKNIGEISNLCDMLIVARGDLAQLGNFMELGIYQDEIVKVGKEKKLPVIIATQILDSLISNFIPSRADIIDLHHIFQSSVNGLMLADVLVKSDRQVDIVKIINKFSQLYEEKTNHKRL